MIYVDSKEPTRLKTLLANKGVEVKGEYLQVGDYLLPGDTVVERKTNADFISSIFDKRIWIQAKNLTQYKHPIICIISENKWKEFYYRKNSHIYKVWLGVIATLSCAYNISVIILDNEDEFIDFLQALDKKLSSEKESTRMDPLYRRANNDTEVRENIISMIPGIGIKTSQDILSKYGSITNICNATVDDLSTINGIGIKTAEKIYKYLH